MPTPVQIGAATAAIGGGALGGYFLANGLSSTGRKLENTEDDSSLPNADVFGSTTIFDTSSPYSGKFLTLTHQNHLDYLVKPTNSDNSIQKWWEYAFSNKFKNKNLDNVFSAVNSAYSPTALTTGNQTALNQACDAAYKKEKTDYKFGATDYLLKNISDFCTKRKESVDVSEPKFNAYQSSYSPTEEYEVGVLSVSANLNNLVKKDSDNTNNNDFWWNWAYSKRMVNKDGLSDTFKNVSSGYDASAATALNNACDATYKKDKIALSAAPTSPVKNKLLDEIQNLCAVNPKTPLTLPADDKEPQKTTLTTESATTYSAGLPKVTGNQSKLVDIIEGNKKWWGWAYRNRFLKKPSEKTFNTHFDDVKKGYHSSDANSLNKKCEEAYKKGKTDLEKDTNKLIDAIKQFCAISINETLTTDGLS